MSISLLVRALQRQSQTFSLTVKSTYDVIYGSSYVVPGGTRCPQSIPPSPCNTLCTI